MKIVFCCFTIFLLTASPKTPVIFSLKDLIVFNSLAIDFFAFSGGHHCENQPVFADAEVA